MDVVDEILAHHGVKGMKWGVRKNYQSLRNKPTETLKLTTSKGAEVTIHEERVGPIHAGIGSFSPRFRKAINETRAFSISSGGKDIGNAHIREKSKDVVNFAWISVNPKQRGKGYATTVFDAGVSYAKSKGYSKITLEVPGRAPDARHIYEKMGFKPTGEVLGTKNDLWGGLTVMEYNIPKSVVIHHADTVTSDELEKALEQTFDEPNADNFLWGGDMTHVNANPVDKILEHHGVKGMKWGVRRRSQSGLAPSKKASGTSQKIVSEDASTAKVARTTAKKHSVDALSNKELQHLVNRMNLEQQYSKLTSHQGTLKIGVRAGKKVLIAGKTVSDVYNTVNSPAYKSLATMLKKHTS